MIYIIEIPHQRPASCWSVHNELQAVDAINASAIKSGELFETFGAAVAWLESDLSSLIVCGSDSGALACLADESMWQRHGGWAARDELRSRLINDRVLDEQEEPPEAA